MDKSRSNIISFSDKKTQLRQPENVRQAVDKINYVDRVKVDLEHGLRRVVEELDTHEARIEALEAHILQLTKYLRMLAEKVESK